MGKYYAIVADKEKKIVYLPDLGIMGTLLCPGEVENMFEIGQAVLSMAVPAVEAYLQPIKIEEALKRSEKMGIHCPIIQYRNCKSWETLEKEGYEIMTKREFEKSRSSKKNRNEGFLKTIKEVFFRG